MMVNMYADFVRQKQRQAGKNYEAFITNRLKAEGWTVTETGLDGFNDHGIDIIATKNGITRYVQCKGWKRWKTISDDVVSQLYGSVAGTVGPENMAGVELYIYSPASLSPYAQEEAAKLHVQFVRMGYPHWHRRKHF